MAELHNIIGVLDTSLSRLAYILKQDAGYSLFVISNSCEHLPCIVRRPMCLYLTLPHVFCVLVLYQHAIVLLREALQSSKAWPSPRWDGGTQGQGQGTAVDCSSQGQTYRYTYRATHDRAHREASSTTCRPRMVQMGACQISELRRILEGQG